MLEKKIVKIEVLQEVDAEGYLEIEDFYGTYSQTPGDKNRTIDRQKAANKGNLYLSSNEFRYFIASNSTKDTGNPESVKQDYQRAEAFNRDEWNFLILQAVATIQVGNILQSITSGTLGGVESDRDETDLQEFKEEQLFELKQQLLALGFSEQEIDTAVKNAK